MGKLKSINWQELLFNWADKVVIAVCGLFAAWAIWSAFSTEVFKGDPLAIVDNAKRGKNTIAANRWPDEEADKFKLNADELPEAVVYAGIYEPVPPGVIEYEEPFAVTTGGQLDEPIKEPEWMPVESMIADASEVIIPQAAVDDDEADDVDDAIAAVDPKSTESNSALPEELRDRRPSTPPGYGSGDEYGAPSDYVDEEALYGGYGGSAGDDILVQGVDGEGHQFVAVRGIFPLRKQVERIKKAINVKTYVEARAALDMIQLQIERRAFRPGSDAENVDWQAVDLRVAEDVLLSSAGLEPDAVPVRITDPVITMPLPARVRGYYGTKATHPRIENFVLSPEEQERELAILRAMSEEIVQQGNEEKLNAPAEKQGFSSFVVGSGALYTAYNQGFDDYDSYGADESYGGGAPGGGYPGGGYPGGGYPGEGYGGGYGYGVQSGLTDQALEKILKKLDPDERDKGLKEWIKKQSTAVEELLLFRYLDFDVEPGMSYQYRVRLEVRNPNFGRSVADAGGLAHVVEGQTRLTDWSEPTPVATTKTITDFYVARVRPPRGRVPITADVSVFQWDSDLGTVVQGKLEVHPGQLIGGSVQTEVLDPAAPSLQVETYEFKSDDVFLGGVADSRIDKEFHAGIELPFGARGGELMLPEAIVLADETGALIMVDEVASNADYKRRQSILKLEREQYAHLRDTGDAPTDLEGYYDEFGGGELDEYGGGYGPPTSGRRSSNPLTRKRRSASR